MQLRTIKPISMKETLAQVRAMPLFSHPSSFMWLKSLSVSNQFCDAVVRAGYLSYEQMFSAACRYCIGASKLGGVIFWQIDHEGRVHDGKVMYYLPDCHRNKEKSAHPNWVSALLARRNGNPKGTSSHCLFGLHLVREEGKCLKNVNVNDNQQSTTNSQFSILNSHERGLQSYIFKRTSLTPPLWGGISLRLSLANNSSTCLLVNSLTKI